MPRSENLRDTLVPNYEKSLIFCTHLSFNRGLLRGILEEVIAVEVVVVGLIKEAIVLLLVLLEVELRSHKKSLEYLIKVNF